MNELNNLLASIATTIRTYREGELAVPTAAHVDRWASQFTPQNKLDFLREFDHVLKQTFLTKEMVSKFLNGLVKNEKLVGEDAKTYWASANLLNIQQAGQSQKAMVELFAQALQEQCGLKLANLGTDNGDYIYLDDVLFTGGRVATDLEKWITEKAPAKAKVHVILIALHTSGHYYLTATRLRKSISSSGKKIEIHFWRLLSVENQKIHKDTSTLLWPAVIPNDVAVQAYIESEKKYPLALRKPGGPLGVFSSETGRQLLEAEFLIAGVKIRSKIKTPKDYVRPLGHSSFGAGFGSLIATYRNCPNNCPLPLWWGDPTAVSGALHWYPLLSRKTYAAPENVFYALN